MIDGQFPARQETLIQSRGGLFGSTLFGAARSVTAAPPTPISSRKLHSFEGPSLPQGRLTVWPPAPVQSFERRRERRPGQFDAVLAHEKHAIAHHAVQQHPLIGIEQRSARKGEGHFGGIQADPAAGLLGLKEQGHALIGLDPEHQCVRVNGLRNAVGNSAKGTALKWMEISVLREERRLPERR